ncbi:MAG: hypothetical protein GC190_19525 [Alphaproteobacteria bacterium]|nr:hypothetical protein [Alphaproteobacteria bacterium]
MRTRLVELVALGPELRVEAQKLGHGVNESYLLVHKILTQAFREDPARVPSDALRAHLTSKLQRQVRNSAAA